MKPKNIYLVRHGESEGNIDYGYYATKPDYQLQLTPNGRKQAVEAGHNLVKQIGNDKKIMFYVSPLWRTRQTFECIVFQFEPGNIIWREEPRIREQEWGHLRPREKSLQIEEEREVFGTFYYRMPDGESCADVYDRMSDFLNTLHRDFQRENYPENIVIVTHGTSIRLLLMRWLHWTVEEFEATANPKNCQVFKLELQETGKYKLATPLKKREISSESKLKEFKWAIPDVYTNKREFPEIQFAQENE